MTGTPPLSGIVYFLDRDLAVMYGCGFARYALVIHARPSGSASLPLPPPWLLRISRYGDFGIREVGI